MWHSLIHGGGGQGPTLQAKESFALFALVVTFVHFNTGVWTTGSLAVDSKRHVLVLSDAQCGELPYLDGILVSCELINSLTRIQGRCSRREFVGS